MRDLRFEKAISYMAYIEYCLVRIAYKLNIVDDISFLLKAPLSQLNGYIDIKTINIPKERGLGHEEFFSVDGVRAASEKRAREFVRDFKQYISRLLYDQNALCRQNSFKLQSTEKINAEIIKIQNEIGDPTIDTDKLIENFKKLEELGNLVKKINDFDGEK